jgi:hypothetical protein
LRSSTPGVASPAATRTSANALSRCATASGPPAASRSQSRSCHWLSSFQKPSAMMYRNLLSMEAEEVLRSYPFDGAVLMGGCDKTTPALVMGAISADLPAIFLPAGPMLRGNLARAIRRQRHRRVAALGRARGGRSGRVRVARTRGRHRALARALYDDGDGLDDDGGGRCARTDAAGRVFDSSGRCRSCPHGRGMRACDRGAGLGGGERRACS